MLPSSNFTPDAEVGDEEQDQSFREHYYTRQRRRKELDPRPTRSDKRRAAENVIREKRAKEKIKDGKTKVREELDKRSRENKKCLSDKQEDQMEGRKLRKTQSRPVQKKLPALYPASFDEDSESHIENTQSIGKTGPGESSTIDKSTIGVAAPTDEALPTTPQLDASQKSEGSKSKAQRSSPVKKRKRAESSNDSVPSQQSLRVDSITTTLQTTTPETRRNKKDDEDTPKPTSSGKDVLVDYNDSDSEDSLEKVVRETRRYLTLALNNIEKIDFEERRLRNEERKLSLEERRIIALENLTKGSSK